MKVVILSIFITILSIIILFIIIPYAFGYKPVYMTDVSYDFQAISAVGQWVGALIPIFLVFLSVFVTNKFNNAKKEINQSNVATIDYVNDMINELNKKIITNSNPNPKELNLEENLKEKAYKYVCIAGVTYTQNVAKHLKVNDEEAFDILNELLKVDGKISAGGRTTKDNLNNIVWLKKKNSSI